LFDGTIAAFDTAPIDWPLLATMDRHNGQIIGAKPYTDVNWTKGIDQKTGKPIEYDPTKDIQTYAGIGNLTRDGSGCGFRPRERRRLPRPVRVAGFRDSTLIPQKHASQ
jgi:hypothetical protein